MIYSQIKQMIQFLVEQEIYKTKQNQEITFKVNPDSEGDENRGWIVHHIDAYVDGEAAGYLKMSYIPMDRFKKHYPSIIDYVSEFRGVNVLYQFHKQGKTFLDITPEEKLKTLSYLNFVQYGSQQPFEMDQIQKMDPKKIEELNKKLYKSIEEKNMDKFVKFRNYHVDKPLVDFIRVDPDKQRQRIAIALYEYGAKYLAKKGMKLYASGIQSDSAKAAWEWLKKNKRAEIGIEKYFDERRKKKTRTFLSYL